LNDIEQLKQRVLAEASLTVLAADLPGCQARTTLLGLVDGEGSQSNRAV